MPLYNQLEQVCKASGSLPPAQDLLRLFRHSVTFDLLVLWCNARAALLLASADAASFLVQAEGHNVKHRSWRGPRCIRSFECVVIVPPTHRHKERLRTRTQNMAGRSLVTNATLLLLSLQLLSQGICFITRRYHPGQKISPWYYRSCIWLPRHSQVGGSAGAAAPSPAPQTPPFYLGFATAAAQVLLVMGCSSTLRLQHCAPPQAVQLPWRRSRAPMPRTARGSASGTCLPRPRAIPTRARQVRSWKAVPSH